MDTIATPTAKPVDVKPGTFAKVDRAADNALTAALIARGSPAPVDKMVESAFEAAMVETVSPQIGSAIAVTLSSTIVDPRAAGFNYGIGNPTATKQPIYVECEAILARLNEAYRIATDRAWKGEMVLRAYRHAETAAEISKAHAALCAWYVANDPRDSKGDPSPNYSFAQLAAIGAHVVYPNGIPQSAAIPYTGQPSPGAAVNVPPERTSLRRATLAACGIVEREARATDPELIYGETI